MARSSKQKTYVARPPEHTNNEAPADDSTGILISHEKSLSNTASNVQTSPLLRLPAELRNLIYDYVFSVGKIYFRARRLSLKSYFCRAQLDGLRPLNMTWMDYLAPSLVCRQIYHESRCHPYKCNTFVVDDWIYLSQDWASVLAEDKCNAIRAIHIKDWDLWADDEPEMDALNTFHGLQHISVSPERKYEYVRSRIKDWASKRGKSLKYTEEDL